MGYSLAAMRPILLWHTFDLDSTVMCRYGEQEGLQFPQAEASIASSVGGVFGRRRRLLWATLRFGDTRSANGDVEFMKQPLTRLPPGASDWVGVG